MYYIENEEDYNQTLYWLGIYETDAKELESLIQLDPENSFLHKGTLESYESQIEDFYRQIKEYKSRMKEVS